MLIGILSSNSKGSMTGVSSCLPNEVALRVGQSAFRQPGALADVVKPGVQGMVRRGGGVVWLSVFIDYINAVPAATCSKYELYH